MKLKFFLCSLAIIFSGALLLNSSALARLACEPVCKSEAKSAFQDCISECREVFQQAKDSCRNIDHVCAEDCRALYDACIVEPLSDLAECKLPCNTSLVSAATICRTEFSRGTHERDMCIDQAQIVAFACKDNCREQFQPALTLCRKAFKECILNNCKLP